MPHKFGCSGERCDCFEPEDDDPLLLGPPPEVLLEEASRPRRFEHFRTLPGELRLRILRSTHLGPPDLGGYASSFDKLLIRDGRLDNDTNNLITNSSSPCPYRAWHGCVSPPCRCRILPMALFLVDRQMHLEASEVFYSHVFLNFHGDDFNVALSVLRGFPLESGLRRIRRLQFTMTVAQCEGWGAGALASGYPESSLSEIGRCYWDATGGVRPDFDYQAGWRAIVSFLAENADLPCMSITVDMGTCGWSFIDISEMLAWDDLNFSWFEFIYDFYIGIATTMCSLKALGAVHFDLCPFKKLKPWLEREVLGSRYGNQTLKQAARQGFGNHIPSWHNMNRRLEGSNYVPKSHEVNR